MPVTVTRYLALERLAPFLDDSRGLEGEEGAFREIV